MRDIKNNLHKQIKDCEPDSNEECTYLEVLIYAATYGGDVVSSDYIDELLATSNERLNELMDEAEWLLGK